jgi:hypothetical protein
MNDPNDHSGAMRLNVKGTPLIAGTTTSVGGLINYTIFAGAPWPPMASPT